MLDRGAQALRVRIDPDRVGLSDELEAFPVRLLHERRDEFAEVEPSFVQAEVSGLELADLENVLGEAIEVAALSAQLQDRVALSRAESGCPRGVGDRSVDLGRGPPERVRDEGERFLAMRIDALEGVALPADLIEEDREHEEDHGARDAVPDARRDRYRRARNDVGGDPGGTGEDRGRDRGTTSQPPARDADRDQVEDRESVFGPTRDVHQPDDGDAENDQKGHEKRLSALHVDVGDAAPRDARRPQGGLRLAHPAQYRSNPDAFGPLLVSATEFGLGLVYPKV